MRDSMSKGLKKGSCTPGILCNSKQNRIGFEAESKIRERGLAEVSPRPRMSMHIFCNDTRFEGPQIPSLRYASQLLLITAVSA